MSHSSIALETTFRGAPRATHRPAQLRRKLLFPRFRRLLVLLPPDTSPPILSLVSLLAPQCPAPISKAILMIMDKRLIQIGPFSVTPDFLSMVPRSQSSILVPVPMRVILVRLMVLLSLLLLTTVCLALPKALAENYVESVSLKFYASAAGCHTLTRSVTLMMAGALYYIHQ